MAVSIFAVTVILNDVRTVLASPFRKFQSASNVIAMMRKHIVGIEIAAN